MDIKIPGNPLPFDFSQVGGLLGQQLGYRLAKGNVLVGVVSSAALQTLGDNLGDVLDGVVGRGSVKDATETAFSEFGDEFLTNLKSAGLGAISSFLTAQLIDALGVGGFGGEVLNTTAGTVIGQIVANIGAGRAVFDGLSAGLVANAVGSFLGTKLASEIVSFGSIGGQIGSAVGSAVGVIALTTALGTGGSLANIGAALGAAAGPIGAAIGAFVGFLVGGLIGSVFGGTPRSGADASWDEASGRFVVSNVYSKKGGSKDAAKSVASAVADTFNAVLEAAGGTLLDPEAVQSGNYGMRKSDFVYRPISTRDKDAITQRFSGADAATKLIGYGVVQGLTDPDFQIAGGDVYVKRALYNTFAGGVDARNFDVATITGNIASAQAYTSYLANASVIGALVAAEPDSVFAIETLITLARADELGLTRRGASDWYGGFSFLLKEAGAGAADVEFGFDYDPFSDRVSRLIGVGDYVLGDTIDVAGQAVIEGTAANDTIDLRSGGLVDRTGLTVKGLKADGRIDVAATVDGGAGNDVIHASNLGDNLFGGAGNDALYGGRLDDWLLGGDGNDLLDAGSADQLSPGGDGNYLNGGAGDDVLLGREGSDWLEGGEGTDLLTGGAGDDILVGGAGALDSVKGGSGDDQYIVRRGDGEDLAEDEASPASTGAGSSTGDAVAARYAGIAAGAIGKNWAGASMAVQARKLAGGEDALVFGAGIDIGDIQLMRATDAGGAPGGDLIVRVMQTDPATGVESYSGTSITVRDWFSNPFKRIEWLKFADGNEVRIGDITSFIIGGAGNDVLIGTAGNDFVYGGAGDDELRLLAGNDIGNGGSGNDLVSGDEGRDLVIGGLGNDNLLGGAGADAISGDDGADDVYGGADRDILAGGHGDDQVAGGAGDDIFKFARGDGRDTVFDDFADYWQPIWTSAGGWNEAAGYHYEPLTGEVTGPGGSFVRKNLGTAESPNLQWIGRFDYDAATTTLKYFNPPAGAATIVANNGIDTIEFAPGINIQDVILRHVGNDLVLAIGNDDLDTADSSRITDSVAIKDWYVAPGGIEKLAFFETGVLDIAAGTTNLIAGTDGDDGVANAPLAGTVAADWITGGAGDDVIAGGTGADILAGNSGSDMLRGEAGDDVLYGGTGNDVLDGGAGRDVLLGGAGDDTASYASASAAVRVRLGFEGNNTGDAVGDEFHSIENVVGGSGADNIGGDDDENELTGGGGADMLLGGAGNDTYVWNATDGADTIRDGAFVVEEAVTADGQLAPGFAVSSWEDTGIPALGGSSYWRLQVTGPDGALVYDYANFAYSGTPAPPPPSAWFSAGWLGGFAKTNGQQVTRDRFDSGVSGGDNDVLELGAGITLADLTFEQTGQDLIIHHAGGAAITLKDQLTSYGHVETLQFRDGLAVSLASVLSASGNVPLAGTAGDDLIAGQAGSADDSLSGGDGNDVLSGLGGNDLIYGEAGDDVFEGGAGADLLDGGAGAGDTARYVGSGSAVAIDLRNTTSGQSGGDAAGDILVGIENLVGSVAGADMLTGDDGANRIDGLDGDNIIDGRGGNDVLVTGSGADQLHGGLGDDNISSGDGNDALWGGEGADIVFAGTGDDFLHGDGGNDQLLGGDGNDVLEGSFGDDQLQGDSGNDQLLGGDGNDTLGGGSGNDLLQGGNGDDTYYVEANAGSDSLTDLSGVNVISFDTKVTYDRIWLTQAGSDLRVGVIGQDTALTVTGFFAAADRSVIRSIQTATHAIFLDHPDTLNLIAAMTAASAGTPLSVPASISALQGRYWHAGGKAVPIAPSAPRAIATNEDVAVTIDGAYGVVDHDGNITGYALKSDAAPAKGTISAFDAATGALVYTPDANVNGTDSFTVIVTDADGQSAELSVSVSIAAVNDAPGPIGVAGGTPLAILESAPGSTTTNGTIIGTLTASDVEGDLVTYSLSGNAGGRFTISDTGVLSVANAALLDREANASHLVQVVATDLYGAATTSEFRIDIGNVNEAPGAPQLTFAAGPVGEYVSAATAANAGAVVARFTTVDPDGDVSPSLTFDLLGNPGGIFAIVGNEVRLAGNMDFEALVAAGFVAAEGKVTLAGAVKANDGALDSGASTGFSIQIADVNELQTAIALAGIAASIDERDRLPVSSARPEVVLGSVSVVDPDLGTELTGQQTFQVFENGSATVSSRFAVNSANQLVLLANQSLDFETDGASIALTVRATDKSASPFSFDQSFSFEIVNKDDLLEGTAGNDLLIGQQNRDILRGYAGNDTINGGDGEDQLEGGDGDDTLNGEAGADLLVGQAGNDTISGGLGNDTFYGQDGDDTIDGGDGEDIIYGQAGNEGARASGSDFWRGFTQARLLGGLGNDVIDAGDGDDYLDGGAGGDRLVGGLGFDGVTYETSNAAVNVNLATGHGTGGTAEGDMLESLELLQGSAFGDTLTGSISGDVIDGGAGNDTITGGLGDDYLLGGAGDDTIDAEAGDDYLDGGMGNDLLIGGDNNDTYVINRNQGADNIRNFDPGGTDFDHLTFDSSIVYTDVWFERVDDAGNASSTGNHVRMNILGANGTEGSVTVENWFTLPGRDQPENYFKIDLVSDGINRATMPINIDALVSVMAAIPPGSRPTTQAQMAALLASNIAFRTALEDNWGRLTAPNISDVGNITTSEPLDGETRDVAISVRAWYAASAGSADIPASNIDIEVSALPGYNLADFATVVSTGTPDAEGNRIVTLRLNQNVSGSIPLQMTARIRGTTRTANDAGGFTLYVSPTADTPYFQQLSSSGGNAFSYIPIAVTSATPDTDGSERVDLLIGNLPAGYLLTNGNGTPVGTQEGPLWRLTPAQAVNLHLYVPPGSHENAVLSITPQSIDGGSVRNGATSTLTVNVNGSITALGLRGSGASATPHLAEFAPGSTTNNLHIGVVAPVDPDSLENNMLSTDFNLLPKAGGGEERVITGTGPTGGIVQVLETGQISTNSSDGGGGVYGVDAGTIDRTKAYKYTIYVKPENNIGHYLYFGAGAGLENAANGGADGNPYFWYANSNSLIQDRWYRIEGYVLPEGHELVPTGLFGGVFDTVTGQKVADTTAFRFAPGTTNAYARFFSYYGQANSGYSAQWYQPVVEKLDYTYSLDDSAGGRFRINAASGLVTAVGSAFDREAAASHNIVARVTDSGGLVKTQTLSIAVDNVNEAPNAPNGGALTWSFFDETGLGANPATPGGAVASFSLSDVDGTTPALAFAQDPGSWFQIVGDQVRFTPGTNFNFESLRADGYGIYDWNGDGRADAHIANVYVKANDGALDSPSTLLQLFISDVNERPNNLAITGQTLHSETVAGDTPHSGRIIASFAVSDPDGATPQLVITGGNANNWFTTSGGQLHFNGANFSADWLRATRGQYGQDADFYYDTDGDGLREIRVATLTLKARDAAGLESDPFTYDVLIEDKNEAPTWSASSFAYNLAENPGYYQYVGTLSGTDIDGPVSELRYAFTDWGSRYWDGSLGSYAFQSPDGRFTINETNGHVYVKASQAFNFEAGPLTYNYSIRLYDKGYGPNNTYRDTTLTVNLQDVNEPHNLANASASVSEVSGLPPLTPLVNARALTLSDPENSNNFTWRFTNGTSQSGIWQISGDGIISLISGSVDYESLVEVYDYVQTGYDPYDYTPIYTYSYVGNDPARATFNLGVQATDNVTGLTKSSNLALSVTNVNEAPTYYSSATYSSSGGASIYKSNNEFWVTANRNGGGIVQISAADPERTGGFTYSITNVQTPIESIGYYGGSSEIDATGNPYVYIDANGLISFYTPGEGNNGEWEGGLRIGGVRRTSSVTLNFTLNITDATGVTRSDPFRVVFVRRDTNAPPIVLDLDGDGLELIPYENSPISFDADADGIRDETGWVGADDGFLALDRNGNGAIDDISEISFVGDAEGATSDLEGLRQYDSNNNGYFDSADAQFGNFVIWRDANQDGISQPGELLQLAALGISSINLALTLTGDQPQNGGNTIYGTTEFNRTDGSTGIVGDVFIGFTPSNVDGLAAPVVLDFDGDGAGLVKVGDSNVRFDQDGDGLADRTGWIETGDAFLSLDRNGNGSIDDIREISFTADLAGAKTDLEGLRAFDSNKDSLLTAEDARFPEFRLWFDRNSNGITDAGELLSLAEAGVVGLNLTGTKVDAANTTARPNIIYNTSTFTRANGTSGTTYDAGIGFEKKQSNGSTQIATAGVGIEPQSALPKIMFESRSFDKKASKFGINVRDNGIFVEPGKPAGAVDMRAGSIGPASLLSFSNVRIGLLSPIILDLDGDGIDLKGRKKTKARFDMDGDGIADDTGWVGKGDGILVIDRNNDGNITANSEISFLTEKLGAKSDFEALATLDTNRDGKLDASDKRFSDLKVWVDANQNGTTENGELKSLADLNIAEISLAGRPGAQKVAPGANAIIATSTFKRTDGSVGTIAEAGLAFGLREIPAVKPPRPFKPRGEVFPQDNRLAAFRRGIMEGFGEFVPDADGPMAGPRDQRLAQMIQAMSTFGTASSAADMSMQGLDPAQNPILHALT